MFLAFSVLKRVVFSRLQGIFSIPTVFRFVKIRHQHSCKSVRNHQKIPTIRNFRTRIVIPICISIGKNPLLYQFASHRIFQQIKNFFQHMEDWKAYRNGNTRKGYWAVAGSGIFKTTITNERLAQAGYFDMARKYKSLHSLYRIFEATRRDPGSGPVCSSPPRGRCR